MIMNKDEIMMIFFDFYLYHRFNYDRMSEVVGCCPFSDLSQNPGDSYYRMPKAVVCNQTCWKYFNITCLECPCHVYGSRIAMYQLQGLLKREGYIDES